MDMRRQSVRDQLHPTGGYSRAWLYRMAVYAICAATIALAGLAYRHVLQESSMSHIRATNTVPTRLR